MGFRVVMMKQQESMQYEHYERQRKKYGGQCPQHKALRKVGKMQKICTSGKKSVSQDRRIRFYIQTSDNKRDSVV